MISDIDLQSQLNNIKTISFTSAYSDKGVVRVVESGVDVVLIDLEDSVGSEYKNVARHKACTFFQKAEFTESIFGVRINSINTEIGVEDILALRAVIQSESNFLHVVVIPKVETSSDLHFVDRLFNTTGQKVLMVALVETVKGIQNIDEICTYKRNLLGVMFGSSDYTRDLGGEICWDTLLFPRIRIVQAARASGIISIDTPYFDIYDLEGLRKDTQNTKKLGFNARCVIHPKQAPVINEVFSISEATTKELERIVVAVKESKGNICAVDGKMIGQPMVLRAESILREQGKLRV